MRTIFLVALLVLLMPGLHGQETVDILSISGRYGLPSDYQDATISGTASEWGSLNSLTAGFNVGEKSMIAINVNHFYFNVQGDPEPAFAADIMDPIKINGVILRAGLRQDLGKGRMLQLLVAPRLMSDFRNLDGNSFQIGAVASYTKRFHEDLAVGFGAIYNGELFGTYVVPILDLNWRFAERWRIRGMIPVTARVEFNVNENMLVGFNHFGLITTYYLGGDAYAGDYMERQSIDESLFIRHRLAGNIFVEFMAGRALGRSYRQYAGDQKVDFALPLVTFGDDRVISNESAAFDDGFILTLKLVYNMPLPQ